MRRPDRAVSTIAATALAAALALPARALPLASHPVVTAVRRGDCDDAVRQLNTSLNADDAATDLLAGRMLNEGICVRQDRLAATSYFSRAADLGDRVAMLDYAAKIGLGEGGVQSYERAGTLCRSAGLDQAAHLSDYSLGYACTLAALTAEMLRTSLPKGAWRPNSGPLLVAIQPASARLSIRATPDVGFDQIQTGSHLHTPLFDVTQEIDKAWRSALAAVPRPDPAHLEDQTVELTLDVDMTLEIGATARHREDSRHFGPLYREQITVPNTH
jgi:hypothetical protein